MTDICKRTPAIISMVRDQNWKEIERELDENSDLAMLELQEASLTFPYPPKKYLLQLLLENNAPLQLVQALVNRNPLNVLTSSSLHVAVQFCAIGQLDIEIVKFLANHYPQTLCTRFERNFPLHVALVDGLDSLELIDVLCTGEALRERSARGLYPIEHALLKGFPMDKVVKMMISFTDHTRVDFSMKLVRHAFKGHCAPNVLTWLIESADRAIAGAEMRDYEERKSPYEGVIQAFANCVNSGVFESEICNEIMATKDGARGLLKVIFSYGEHLVANCADMNSQLKLFVTALVNRYPELAASKRHGPNMLHDAIRRGAPAVVLRVLVRVNPASLTERITYQVSQGLHNHLKRAGTALHAALRTTASARTKEVVEVLFEANPLIILGQETIVGYTGAKISQSIIQLALELKVHASVVEVLLKYGKEFLHSPNAWSNCLENGLIKAYMHKRESVAAIRLSQDIDWLNSLEFVAEEQDDDVIYSALILHILSLRPGDATRGDGSGIQPVHDVISFVTAEVVLKLLEFNKEAAKVQLTYNGPFSTHTDGMMLLHMAVSRQDVLQNVIDYYPGAVHVRGEGYTPIERAVLIRSPLECVKILMENSSPRLGLCAVAIRSGAPTEVCEYLLREVPTDIDGNLLILSLKPGNGVQPNAVVVDMIVSSILKKPHIDVPSYMVGGEALALALQLTYSLELYEKLLRLYPGAAGENIANDGSLKYPLVDALQVGVSNEVLTLLLTKFPEATLLETNKVALWDQVVRDSEFSQLSSDMPSKDANKFTVSKDQVIMVCLAAVRCKNAIFTAMMSLREMQYSTAEAIIRQLFDQHHHWTYLCREAAEKAKDNDFRALLNKYWLFDGRYEQQIGAPLHCSATAVVVEFNDHGVRAEYVQSYEKYLKEGLVSAMALVHVDATASHEQSLVDFVTLASSAKTPNAACGNETTTTKASLTDYVNFCVGKFGRTRKVVIKFMRDKTQFEREHSTRLDAPKGKLDEKYVVSLLQEMEFLGEIATKSVAKILLPFLDKVSTGTGENSIEEFRFGLVMPAADRSVDAIFRSERPGINHVRTIMSQIGLALQHCHEYGIVHGDLKMLNVVRFGDRIRLIDMDASCVIGDNFLGAKFSSGVLPPEMFAEVNASQVDDYKRYWHADVKENSAWWRKIEPRTVINRSIGAEGPKTYVVKAYRTWATSNTSANGTSLPYDLMRATTGVDIWAFGCMLYIFLSGESLLPVNIDDDLKTPENYKLAASWVPRSITEKIRSTIDEEKCYLAVNLLKSLLDPDAARRGATSMTTHLQHPFFQDAIKIETTSAGEYGVTLTDLRADLRSLSQQSTNQHVEIVKRFDEQRKIFEAIHRQTVQIMKNTKHIEQMSARMISQIKRTEKIMLRAMFEAADVIVPSCFVILNQRIEPEDEEAKSETQMEAAQRWTEKLYNVAKTVRDTLSGGESSLVHAAVEKLMEGEVLWLYLVDEYTQLPVIGHSAYPIEITKPHQIVPKVLPLLRVALKAVWAFNSAVSIARCFGYPGDGVPEEMYELASSAVDGLSKKSSVEEYDCLQSILDTQFTDSNASSSQIASLRGEPLRALAEFLAKNDSQYTFSGLIRVATEDGMCCWTHPDNKYNVSEGVAYQPPPVTPAPALVGSASQAQAPAQPSSPPSPSVPIITPPLNAESNRPCAMC